MASGRGSPTGARWNSVVRGDYFEATVSATDSSKGDSCEGEGRQWTVRVGAAEAMVDGKWADSGQWASRQMVDGGGC